ncbi:fungal transcriptional regulatory-like protein [Thermothelomyces thermophilus ATCC 42464]|uniref:Fungal transcriptional regulatory-like protein n=1 Tax=Thermothelomyces thermophilus (strain ATCC 42464 / BCRC 31852 / DSM 1799) TaxID=573729 RepID=G2QDP9_THET4|nr:fungal transcriptional regulatory-like protein [Thermothelomyces thermophilus ATCC 42464]AEO58360.1 fungal transcriptional regulatory-like protein [Thermothelomyces thermophilus ATCC 42464]
MLHSEPGTQVATAPRPQWRSSKLRDSCQACALSKVKCPKEKPSCSRCESRLIPCEYFFTKRPGRRRGNSTAGPKTPTSSDSTSGSTSAAGSISGTVSGSGSISGSISGSSSGSIPGPISGSNPDPDESWTRYGDTIHSLPPISRSYVLPEMTTPARTGNSSLSVPASPRTADAMSVLSNASDMLSVHTGLDSASLAYFSHDIGDMDFVTSVMDSPIDLPMPDICGSNSGGQLGIDVASLLIPDESTDYHDGSASSDSSSSSTADLLNAASGASPAPASPAHRPVENGATGADASSTRSSSPCGCLNGALHLLKTLSSTGNSKSDSTTTADGASGGPDAANNRDPIQAVLQENKQSIESVESMLACPSCTHDSFLLTVLALAVLKVVQRYSAAAWGTTSQSASRYGATAGMTTISAADGEPGDRGGDKTARLANGILKRCPPKRPRSASTTYQNNTPTNKSGGGGGGGNGAGSVDDGMRSRSSSSSNSRSNSNSNSNSSCWDISTEQLVLSELHRAQRVVNKLSPKLRAPSYGEKGVATMMTMSHFGGGGMMQDPDYHHHHPLSAPVGDGLAAPFSVGTLEMVANDVRKSLGTLSSEIISRLRRR